VPGHGRRVIGSGGSPSPTTRSSATVFPAATIAWEQIDDIHLRALHPTVRVGAELLVAPARHKDERKEHAERRRIPIATRHDRVRGDILEPFPDTWFGQEHQQRTMSRLQSAGIGPQQVTELRARFGPAMLMHNCAIPYGSGSTSARSTSSRPPTPTAPNRTGQSAPTRSGVPPAIVA
jgi:hypothetical protein